MLNTRHVEVRAPPLALAQKANTRQDQPADRLTPQTRRTPLHRQPGRSPPSLTGAGVKKNSLNSCIPSRRAWRQGRTHPREETCGGQAGVHGRPARPCPREPVLQPPIPPPAAGRGNTARQLLSVGDRQLPSQLDAPCPPGTCQKRLGAEQPRGTQVTAPHLCGHPLRPRPRDARPCAHKPSAEALGAPESPPCCSRPER